MKLKGIDGGPHKRWSMWINSSLTEEPYQGLTSQEPWGNLGVPRKGSLETGVAWLSSARVVRCWVKSRNERNPHVMLPASSRALFTNCPGNREEGGDDVKSAWPLRPGLHTYYNAWYRMNRDREVEEIEKAGLSSDCRLQLACMKLESLVTAGQLNGGEYVPGPCTHRPSRHLSLLHPKSLAQPQGGRRRRCGR